MGGYGIHWRSHIPKSKNLSKSNHERNIAVFTLGEHYAHPVAQRVQYT